VWRWFGRVREPRFVAWPVTSRDRESKGTAPEMTTIPEYLTVMAMAQHTHETRGLRAVPSAGPSLRERISRRFPRPVSEPGVAASSRLLPELRDYPYRSGC